MRGSMCPTHTQKRPVYTQKRDSVSFVCVCGSHLDNYARVNVCAIGIPVALLNVCRALLSVYRAVFLCVWITP